MNLTCVPRHCGKTNSNKLTENEMIFYLSAPFFVRSVGRLSGLRYGFIATSFLFTDYIDWTNFKPTSIPVCDIKCHRITFNTLFLFEFRSVFVLFLYFFLSYQKYVFGVYIVSHHSALLCFASFRLRGQCLFYGYDLLHSILASHVYNVLVHGTHCTVWIMVIVIRLR